MKKPNGISLKKYLRSKERMLWVSKRYVKNPKLFPRYLPVPGATYVRALHGELK